VYAYVKVCVLVSLKDSTPVCLEERGPLYVCVRVCVCVCVRECFVDCLYLSPECMISRRTPLIEQLPYTGEGGRERETARGMRA